MSQVNFVTWYPQVKGWNMNYYIHKDTEETQQANDAVYCNTTSSIIEQSLKKYSHFINVNTNYNALNNKYNTSLIIAEEESVYKRSSHR